MQISNQGKCYSSFITFGPEIKCKQYLAHGGTEQIKLVFNEILSATS